MFSLSEARSDLVEKTPTICPSPSTGEVRGEGEKLRQLITFEVVGLILQVTLISLIHYNIANPCDSVYNWLNLLKI